MIDLLVLAMAWSPCSQTTSDNNKLSKVDKLAEEEEGEPEGGEGQPRYHHLLPLDLLLAGEEGHGGGQQVVECEQGREDTGADEDVLEQPQVGRVGLVDGGPGQQGEGE